MKDKKKLEVLLKVIKGIYDKNPGMQEMIDVSMIEIYAEEGISPEKVVLICCCLYHNGYWKKKSKEEEDCWRNKKQLMKIAGFTQKGENFQWWSCKFLVLSA